VAKRRSANKEQPRRLDRGTVSPQVLSLLSQRDDLLNEIAVLNARTPLPAIKKATTLLKRHWSMADCGKREGIVRAARLLVHIGKLQLIGTAENVSVKTDAQSRRRTRKTKERAKRPRRGNIL
jgi:hypothetical protein